MLSKDLEESLNEAFKEARSKGHEFMTVEHLLLALLSNEISLNVLNKVGANIEKLSADLSEYIASTTPNKKEATGSPDTSPTLGFQRVLQRAVFHVQSSGRKEVTGANILVAIFSEHESQAVFLLKSQDIERIDIVNFISHGIGKDEEEAIPGGLTGEGAPGEESEGKSALESFATNLNEEAKNGRIDPLVGRGSELERVIQVLCRRRKNNPLLLIFFRDQARNYGPFCFRIIKDISLLMGQYEK